MTHRMLKLSSVSRFTSSLLLLTATTSLPHSRILHKVLLDHLSTFRPIPQRKLVYNRDATTGNLFWLDASRITAPTLDDSPSKGEALSPPSRRLSSVTRPPNATGSRSHCAAPCTTSHLERLGISVSRARRQGGARIISDPRAPKARWRYQGALEPSASEYAIAGQGVADWYLPDESSDKLDFDCARRGAGMD
ncbi:hypothetical protein B0H17DRAFT_1133363 [Mycena rosella]|uniref:Uncharacterized protein n=1 Tax=Mycena rosella TaxID=1033263 RepID=A0AAD7GFE9_MYCRO|nr:hypothetical protein B0H17DRAFT_1133363 [Mycena rosella]